MDFSDLFGRLNSVIATCVRVLLPQRKFWRENVSNRNETKRNKQTTINESMGAIRVRIIKLVKFLFFYCVKKQEGEEDGEEGGERGKCRRIRIQNVTQYSHCCYVHGKAPKLTAENKLTAATNE